MPLFCIFFVNFVCFSFSLNFNFPEGFHLRVACSVFEPFSCQGRFRLPWHGGVVLGRLCWDRLAVPRPKPCHCEGGKVLVEITRKRLARILDRVLSTFECDINDFNFIYSVSTSRPPMTFWGISMGISMGISWIRGIILLPDWTWLWNLFLALSTLVKHPPGNCLYKMYGLEARTNDHFVGGYLA